MSAPRLDEQSEGRYALSGELSFASVPELWRQVTGTLAVEAGELTVDLSQVSRSDSAGLALLVEWMRAAEAGGKTIAFHNIPAQMLTMARVSGLDELLPLVLE